MSSSDDRTPKSSAKGYFLSLGSGPARKKAAPKLNWRDQWWVPSAGHETLARRRPYLSPFLLCDGLDGEKDGKLEAFRKLRQTDFELDGGRNVAGLLAEDNSGETAKDEPENQQPPHVID